MTFRRTLALFATNVISTVGLALLIGCATPSPEYCAPADSSDVVIERELTELTHKWLAALDKRDVALVDKFLSKEFVQTSGNGPVMTKSNLLAFLEKEPQSERLSTDDIVVRVGEPFPVVTYRSVFRVKDASYYAGKDPKESPVMLEVFSSLLFLGTRTEEIERGYPTWRIGSAQHMAIQQMSPEYWARQQDKAKANPKPLD